MQLDANGAVVTPHMVRMVIAELRRNGDDLRGIRCKIHPEQEIALENSVFVTCTGSGVPIQANGEMGRGVGRRWEKIIGGIPLDLRTEPENVIDFERDGKSLASIKNLGKLRAFEGAHNVG